MELVWVLAMLALSKSFALVFLENLLRASAHWIGRTPFTQPRVNVIPIRNATLVRDVSNPTAIMGMPAPLGIIALI